VPFFTGIIFCHSTGGLSGINNIPFYIRDTNLHFFKHWVVNDVLSFIRLALDPCDIEAFGQIYYKIGAFISREIV